MRGEQAAHDLDGGRQGVPVTAVEFLQERVALHPLSNVMLEQRMDCGVPSVWGTSDAVIVSPSHIEVVDLKYPADWDTKVLKPGESVEVTGTLKGVTKTHTDRAKVTGTPLTECPVDTSAPFGDGTSDDESGSKPEAETESKSDDVVTIDGKDYCSDTKVESATDDWNGYRAKPLASTGTAVLGLAGGALAVLLAGGSLLVFRKRHYAQGSGRHTAVNAGK